MSYRNVIQLKADLYLYMLIIVLLPRGLYKFFD
jgi:hypothetical protein